MEDSTLNPYDVMDRLKRHLNIDANTPTVFPLPTESDIDKNHELVGQIGDRHSKDPQQQLLELRKENFHLKFRNHYLEELVNSDGNNKSADVLKENVDLLAENKRLLHELKEKEVLLRDGLAGMMNMEAHLKQEFVNKNTKIFELSEKILRQEREKQQIIDEYERKLSEITQTNAAKELRRKVDNLEKVLMAKTLEADQYRMKLESYESSGESHKLKSEVVTKDLVIENLSAQKRDLEEKEAHLRSLVEMMERELHKIKVEYSEASSKVRKLEREPEYLKKLLTQCEYMYDLERKKTQRLKETLLKATNEKMLSSSDLDSQREPQF